MRRTRDLSADRQAAEDRVQGAGCRVQRTEYKGQADNCPLGSAQTRLICEDLSPSRILGSVDISPKNDLTI